MFGIILMQNRQIDSAIIQLRKSLELDPSSAESRANFGIVFAMNKEYDSAYHHLKIAQSANSQLLGIYPPLLDVELALGKYAECQRDLNYLRKLDPRNTVISRIDAALRNARGE